MAAQSRKNRAHLFLFFFGMPFFAAGCTVGFPGLHMLVRYVAARDWVEAHATVRQLKLEYHSGDEGGGTYEVTCTYTYDFNGRQYHSQRVGLSGGSDNIGAWHKHTHARLHAARAARATVPCFVNPADPAEALLDRDVPFWLLFMHLGVLTVFGGVGTGAIAGGIVVLRQARSRQQMQLNAPEDQPWLADPRWATGIIRPGLASKATWLVAVALIWNILWLPVLIFLPTEVAKGDRLALLGLVGPASGLIIIVVAVRAVIRKRKFGRSYFECQPLPGVIGGHLRGELRLVGEIASLDEIELTLRCRNSITTKSGGESTTHVNTIWENQQTLHPASARFGESEIALSVNFQIPYACRPTDDSDANNMVFWQLLVKGLAAGVDLALTFDVPVFRTAESNPAVGESEQTLAKEEAVVAAAEPPASARIRREQDAMGNTVFIASAWPGLSMAGVLFAAAAVFGGGAAFAGMELFGRGEWFILPFVIVFGLVDLLIWLLFLSFFGSYRITIGPDGLEVRRRFGPFTRRRTVAADRVAGFSCKESASSGDRRRRWYAVYVDPIEGQHVKLAGMIEGEAAAKWFIRQFEEAMTGAGHESRPSYKRPNP